MKEKENEKAYSKRLKENEERTCPPSEVSLVSMSVSCLMLPRDPRSGKWCLKY